jgi:hypothetical protein
VGGVSSRREKLGVSSHKKGWTPEDLGTVPDDELARRLGRSVKAVQWKRFELGISGRFHVRRFWTPQEIAQLGKRPDAELAREWGRTERSVALQRSKLRIRMQVGKKPVN